MKPRSHRIVSAEKRGKDAHMLGQLNAMRELGAEIAHDAINALMSVDCELKLLAFTALPADGAECVHSLSSLTGHLLSLASGLRMAVADPQAKSVHPETVVSEWWPAFSALLHAKVRAGIVIRPAIRANLPSVRVGAPQLTQVALNLVGNAADAIVERRRAAGLDLRRAGDGGEIRVAMAPVRRASAVRLTVEDNGIGMSEEILARAREPYFTTRGGRGGTGLGLAIVNRLVKGAGGTLAIESEPMKGTVVTVVLPAIAA